MEPFQKYCTECGTLRGDNANFCGECGLSFKIPNDKPHFDAQAEENPDDMDKNKLYLLCKPCQSGKTGVVLNSITEYINTMKDIDDMKRIINFVICDNSLLQTTQTMKRGEDTDGITTIELSSKSDISKASDLYLELDKNNKINMVICCGNNQRLDDITKIIQLKKNNPEVVFHIWIDEADKTITKKPEKYIRNLEKMRNVEKIVFITATPQKSLKKGLISTFNNLNLVNIDIVHTDKYLLFKDCQQQLFPFDGENCIQYTKKYLDNVEQPQIGQVWFIPSLSTRKSHDQMENMLLEKHFNVVIKINGVKKTITIMENNEKTKQINIIETLGGDENEVSKWLGEYYYHNLINLKKQWKIAITGNICIGRGITIQSERLDEVTPQQCYISHAIYGPGIACGYRGTQSKCKLYQLCARVCGNIKDFEGFKTYGPPKVISDKKILETVNKMEQLSIDIASKKINGDDKITTKDIYNIWNKNDLVEGKDYKIDYEIMTLQFSQDNLEDTAYLNNAFSELKNDKTELLKGLHNPFKGEENGFFKSSLTTKKEIQDYDELFKTLQQFKGVKSGFSQETNKNINQEQIFRKRLYIAYQDGEKGDKYKPIIIIRYATALRYINANELCKH